MANGRVGPGIDTFLIAKMCTFVMCNHCYPRIKHSLVVYYRLPSLSVIICCSPKCEAVRAATNYHTRAQQTVTYGKECYIVNVIYLPFKHKQFQIILFNCMQKRPP